MWLAAPVSLRMLHPWMAAQMGWPPSFLYAFFAFFSLGFFSLAGFGGLGGPGGRLMSQPPPANMAPSKQVPSKKIQKLLAKVCKYAGHVSNAKPTFMAPARASTIVAAINRPAKSDSVGSARPATGMTATATAGSAISVSGRTSSAGIGVGGVSGGAA